MLLATVDMGWDGVGCDGIMGHILDQWVLLDRRGYARLLSIRAFCLSSCNGKSEV